VRRLVALSVLICAPAFACDAPGPAFGRLESERFVLWMATRPAPVEVGVEFAVDAVLCPKSKATVAKIDAIRFDAWMPAHRHGMNSRPSLKTLAADRWRAEGFLFHMPGRWQFTVDVDTAAGRERLTHDLVLE
jgi:hypothetical protein